MNIEQFTAAYKSTDRNGANGFVRHPFNRKFVYSDGVQECAEAGVYWLLDIVATECAKLVVEQGYQGILEVEVKDSEADLRLSFEDGVYAWQRHIDYTDMPEGRWVFVLGWDGEHVAMILLTEY